MQQQPAPAGGHLHFEGVALLLTRVVSLALGLAFGFVGSLFGRALQYLLELWVFLKQFVKRGNAPSRFLCITREQQRLLYR